MNSKRHIVLFVLIFASTIFLSCEDSKDGVIKPPSNHAPIIVEQSDTFITVGETLYLTASADDEDGDSLSYLLVVHVQWHEPDYPQTTFDGITGQFSFYARITDVPERTFSFVVDDQNGGADTTTFDVIVNK